MRHLLQPLKSPNLRRWACFERHRALTHAVSLSKQRPPGSFELLCGFATMFMNHPGLDEKVICVLVRAFIGVNLKGQNGKARTKQWSLSDAGSFMGLDRNPRIEFLCS
jgi:hypothetical protein